MTVHHRSIESEIYCDFNALVTNGGYRPTSGTIKNLAALGLTLEQAVGRRFVFVSDDADEQGNPDDIMCEGTIVRDPTFGILLETDESGFYHRSERRD